MLRPTRLPVISSTRFARTGSSESANSTLITSRWLIEFSGWRARSRQVRAYGLLRRPPDAGSPRRLALRRSSSPQPAMAAAPRTTVRQARKNRSPPRRKVFQRPRCAATEPTHHYVRGLREPERASLGVLADRPGLARVDNGAAERLDALQRRGDIGDREVGQREGVARPASARMHADRRSAGVRLPALALSRCARLQLYPKELRPEVAGARGIVRGKLDQRQRRVRHRRHDNHGARSGPPSASD